MSAIVLRVAKSFEAASDVEVEAGSTRAESGESISAETRFT